MKILFLADMPSRVPLIEPHDELVIVHSWNPDGARRIADVFRGTCAAVEIRKFSPVSPLISPVYRWVLEDPENSG